MCNMIPLMELKSMFTRKIKFHFGLDRNDFLQETKMNYMIII